MNDVFEIVRNTDTLVVLKVHSDDNLTVALNPYISGDMDYISVTKGGQHILKVIRKDGTSWSFDWGVRGHTLIGETTELLKTKVLEFIGKNYISIEYQGQPVKQVNVYYNTGLRKWEVSITLITGYHIAHFSTIATCLEEIMEEADKLIPGGKGWEPWTSSNGHKSYIMIR